PWKRATLVVGPVLAVVVCLAPGAARVEFEADMGRVMAGQGESRRSTLMKRFRREVESRSTSPVVALTDSLEETRKVHDFLVRGHSRFMMLQDFASIFSFVPSDQEQRAEIVKRMHKELSRKRKALHGKDLENADRALPYLSPAPFGVEQLPQWVKDRFADRDGNVGRFVLLFAHGRKAHADDVSRVLAELDHITVDGKTYSTTASYYILKDAYDIVLKEGPVAVALAALAVLIIVIVDFRRRREVAAAFLPLGAGVVAYLGFMGYTGENLNMFNMVILPTMFGMGIDTSIHLVHRIREEGTGRMEQGAGSTGAAAGMSAATTAIGFGSMVLATNPGLRSIGELAPVGILTCYLASVVLTPSLMFLWNGRKKIGR
ncbi:MAG: hypothetical protein FJ109_06660, partial [Deltaproteobacteria bacterium]|nr:hypothetical protein [Deltaproteobacteria bacterium]